MAPALPLSELEKLLAPFVPASLLSTSTGLLPQLSTYLDVLLRWNSYTNLTAIRDPAEIVQRHFGESLFAASLLPRDGSLLDLGSGAGFPGIPIQLLHPELHVTLAESQGKKAAFLREAVRVLQLKTEVWPRRAEDLPSLSRFDTVALRAVDRMDRAVPLAARLARARLCVIAGSADAENIYGYAPEFAFSAFSIPQATASAVLLGTRPSE